MNNLNNYSCVAWLTRWLIAICYSNIKWNYYQSHYPMEVYCLSLALSRLWISGFVLVTGTSHPRMFGYWIQCMQNDDGSGCSTQWLISFCVQQDVIAWADFFLLWLFSLRILVLSSTEEDVSKQKKKKWVEPWRSIVNTSAREFFLEKLN